MRFTASAFVSGILFSIGLWISGMTDPKKVQGFLDIFGPWDPSLVFVMVGAIAFHSITFYLVTKRKSPMYAKDFLIPSNRKIDKKLIFGAIIFGIGWGLGGYCPGPLLASLATFSTNVAIVTGSMLVGIIAHQQISKIGPSA